MREEKSALKACHVPGTMPIALYSFSLILTTLNVVILTLKIRYSMFREVKQLAKDKLVIIAFVENTLYAITELSPFSCVTSF